VEVFAAAHVATHHTEIWILPRKLMIIAETRFCNISFNRKAVSLLECGNLFHIWIFANCRSLRRESKR
jgi:hypothetical protein